MTVSLAIDIGGTFTDAVLENNKVLIDDIKGSKQRIEHIIDQLEDITMGQPVKMEDTQL